jgi:hypothetical protein
MKNLNEEVNKIKHLFTYKKGDVITESTDSIKSELKKEFCDSDGDFNYDKYYSTECKEAENQGRESFEGCKDGKKYATNVKIGGYTWNQGGFSASRVDYVYNEDDKIYACPNDVNKLYPAQKGDLF